MTEEERERREQIKEAQKQGQEAVRGCGSISKQLQEVRLMKMVI